MIATIAEHDRGDRCDYSDIIILYSWIKIWEKAKWCSLDIFSKYVRTKQKKLIIYNLIALN
jgi:hypothetical protein